MPVDQIERIEIVRGPRSSLYGSDAIGGVIQIFTRRGDGNLTPSFSVSDGTYSTWQGQGGLSGGNEHAWYSLSAAGLHTNGFPACRGVGAPIYAGCFVNPPPGDDGFWNASGSLRGGYRFDSGLELSADWLRVYGDNQYDGDVVNSSRSSSRCLAVRSHCQPSVSGTARSRLARARTIRTITSNGVYVETFDSASQQRFLAERVRSGTASAAHRRVSITSQDRLDSNTPFPVTSRQDIGEFARSTRVDSVRPKSRPSLRSDHDQQFGQHDTGSAAAGYSLSPDAEVDGLLRHGIRSSDIQRSVLSRLRQS